jgi:beta-lactamase regulating signal transducer with metallopeptidase domain
VHTLLGLSSILLVFLNGCIHLYMLRSLADWTLRRVMQLFVLFIPFFSLGVNALHPFLSHDCFVGMPPWSELLEVALPCGMLAVVCGAFCWGMLRWLFMLHLVARRGFPASADLELISERLCKQLNLRRPRLLLCAYYGPLAFTCGVFRPTILLSSWMVEQLDQQELEGVLAHELKHVARKDYLVVLLATILRDAFFYIPTSWIVYRQIQREKEIICDDLAVEATHRPLALASALAKVWMHATDTTDTVSFSGAQPLAEAHTTIHTRIQRLMSRRTPAPSTQHASAMTLRASIATLLSLLAVQSANFMLVLVLVGCIPLSLLENLP